MVIGSEMPFGRAAAGGPATARASRAGLAADVRNVAVWTLVSRIAGFARVAAVAAVLGPTYFGNLYLTTSAIPVAVQELFLGSMIAVLLVPALVRRLDSGEPEVAARLANGILGILLLLALVLVVLTLAVGGLILDGITAAVGDPEVRARQLMLGWPLLAIIMPQICFQVAIAVAIAVQNAHGRFALAAAAPAVENLGIVAVLGVYALSYGIGGDVHDITLGQVMLLALGSTAAIGSHAAVQWLGASHAGIRLRPRLAWREPDIRGLFRLAVPTGGSSLLKAATWLGFLVAGGSVPGGVVALQIGYSLFNLPIALGTRPVATAQMPRLSRSVLDNDMTAFHKTYRQSLVLAGFVVLPASLVFLLMPEMLAQAVSLGDMTSEAGLTLVTAAIFGLGLGLMGEMVTVMATTACYARRDATAPFRAMLLRGLVMGTGIAVALSMMQGAGVILTLCLAMSAANLMAAAFLHRQLASERDGMAAIVAFVTEVLVALATIAPAWLLARYLATAPVGGAWQAVAALGVLGLGGTLYLLVQWFRNAPAMVALLGREAAHAPDFTVKPPC